MTLQTQRGVCPPYITSPKEMLGYFRMPDQSIGFNELMIVVGNNDVEMLLKKATGEIVFDGKMPIPEGFAEKPSIETMSDIDSQLEYHFRNRATKLL